MNRKSTSVDLPVVLEARNKDGIYDNLIVRAKNNTYHDYKSDEVMPKVVLVNDLAVFPELQDIRQDIINGVYDETADEADKDVMREELKDAPAMRKILGL